jgi:hypothetical protein
LLRRALRWSLLATLELASLARPGAIRFAVSLASSSFRPHAQQALAAGARADTRLAGGRGASCARNGRLSCRSTRSVWTFDVRAQLKRDTLGGRKRVSKKSRFLGYDHCLALMRKHDPQLREDGFHELLPHAAEHVDELTRDFREETDHGLRCWLLELIGEAKSPRALPLLTLQLGSSDESFRDWAIRGLQALNTPEARQALFDGGVRKPLRPSHT